MLKKLIFLLFAVLMVIGTVGCSSESSKKQTASNETDGKEESGNVSVKIAHSSWIGYAPLFVAKEKGFFEKNGVDVTLLSIESVADRRSALAANEIDGFATTVDTHIVTEATGTPVVQVVAMDDSYGGDGLVAKKDIKTIKDLEGKKVGVDTTGGASFFWFLYLLDQEGVDASKVKFQNMGASDAGASFVAGHLDAAVTWEPWLTRAKDTDFGHVLKSSDETPGVIADTIGLSKSFAEKNPEAVDGIVKSWYEAIDYMKESPDDANKIMAEAMGQSIEEFEAALPSVRFYGEKENKEYFGTKENPGKLSDLSHSAAKFWIKQEIIDKEPDTESTIGYSFINK